MQLSRMSETERLGPDGRFCVQAAPLYVHVPTPGDHYSPATGSATMTVIYELSRQHRAANGQTRIVVGSETRHDYGVGQCVEVDFDGLPTRRERMVDVVLGGAGLARRFTSAAYSPALDGIDPSFGGPVIVHNAPGSLPLLAEHRPSAALVLYAHNTLFRTYGRRELRRVVARATALVCVSEFLADNLTSRLGSMQANVVVVRNGVDLDRFRPRDTAPDDGVPVVLFVGRVIPEKGPDILIRAARTLLAGERRFRVRIVGSRGFSATDPLSPYEQGLRRLAAGTRGDAIEFAPFVDRSRIVEEYARADILVVPSNWDDPCPLTVPEALACGTPTIASRRGGIPEVGGEAVLYFTPPRAEELAERLAYLLDEPSARVEWGRRAREHALTLAWGPQYEKLRRALE